MPWWTLLPRKLLLAASPIIAVVVVVMVVVFTARRVWRYPLFLIGGTILTGLGVGYSWWVPVWLAAGLAVASVLWAWAHPGSFDRREPPEIAGALLAWADTLTDVTAEAWRVPSRDCVHLSVIGQLPAGVSVRVYGGVPFTRHGIGGDLAPDASTTMPLTVLRARATLGEVTA